MVGGGVGRGLCGPHGKPNKFKKTEMRTEIYDCLCDCKEKKIFYFYIFYFFAVTWAYFAILVIARSIKYHLREKT